MEPFRQLRRGAPVPRLAHDLDLVVALQDEAQALPDEGMVVDEEHANLRHPPPRIAVASKAAITRWGEPMGRNRTSYAIQTVFTLTNSRMPNSESSRP